MSRRRSSTLAALVLGGSVLLPASALAADDCPYGGQCPGGGGGATDTRAPRLTVALKGTGLRRVTRSGRLRVRVTADENVLAQVRATIRPGRRVRRGRRGARRSAALRVTPQMALVLAGGPRTVTLELTRRQRRQLAGRRSARVTVQVLAADRARNLGSGRRVVTVRR